MSSLASLGLNGPTAPKRIGLPHAPDERNELSICRRSALVGSGFPAPEQAEGATVPLDHRLRLDQDESLLPAGEEAREQEPEKSVGVVEARFGRGAPKNRELMAEGQILEQQLRVRLEAGAEVQSRLTTRSNMAGSGWPRLRQTQAAPTSTDSSLPTRILCLDSARWPSTRLVLKKRLSPLPKGTRWPAAGCGSASRQNRSARTAECSPAARVQGVASKPVGHYGLFSVALGNQP
jgi:hypothetical protein